MRLHALALLASATALSTPTAQLSRAATFWRYATPVVAKYRQRVDELQERLGTCLSDEEAPSPGRTPMSAARRRFKRRRAVLRQDGAIVASRQDLFPKQYSNAGGPDGFCRSAAVGGGAARRAEETLRPGGLGRCFF